MPAQVSRFEVWPLTESGSEAASIRRAAIADLASRLAMGVAFVELVSDEDRAVCPACARLAGLRFPIGRAPVPPIDGCASSCGCIVAPVFLE